MPIFDDVEKVIVVPGEGGGEWGCGTIMGGFALLVLFAIVGHIIMWAVGSPKPPPQTATGTLAPISRPFREAARHTTNGEIVPHTPYGSAPSVPVPRQRIIFVPNGLVPPYPRPFPGPQLLGTLNGRWVFDWGGRHWLLPPPPRRPYADLCAPGGMLRWCWINPPNAMARPCIRNGDRRAGWCWAQQQ